MFVSPQNSNIENLMSNVMVSGGEVLVRFLGHDSRALMNGINSLIKEPPETSSLQPGRGSSAENNTIAMIFDFPKSRKMKNKSLLFIRYPVYGIF